MALFTNSDKKNQPTYIYCNNEIVQQVYLNSNLVWSTNKALPTGSYSTKNGWSKFIQDKDKDELYGWYAKFTQSGTLTINERRRVDIFILGGGGGGGGGQNLSAYGQPTGSGGAGGCRRVISNVILTPGKYKITIGAGGAGGPANASNFEAGRGKDGKSSSIVIDGKTYSAKGGIGGYGHGEIKKEESVYYNKVGAYHGHVALGEGRYGNGGTGLPASNYSASYGGNGGDGHVAFGYSNDNFGKFGGGGGGGSKTGGNSKKQAKQNIYKNGSTGKDGGGDGGCYLNQAGILAATNGTANTGGGGGGSDGNGGKGGNGGSGIIIIRNHRSKNVYYSGTMRSMTGSPLYKYYMLCTSGHLMFEDDTTVDIFVAGGGGSGGADLGGGGGGGCYVQKKGIKLKGGTRYAVTVGEGGFMTSHNNGNNGEQSSFKLDSNNIYKAPGGKGGKGNNVNAFSGSQKLGGWQNVDVKDAQYKKGGAGGNSGVLSNSDISATKGSKGVIPFNDEDLLYPGTKDKFIACAGGGGGSWNKSSGKAGGSDWAGTGGYAVNYWQGKGGTNAKKNTGSGSGGGGAPSSIVNYGSLQPSTYTYTKQIPIVEFNGEKYGHVQKVVGNKMIKTNIPKSGITHRTVTVTQNTGAGAWATSSQWRIGCSGIGGSGFVIVRVKNDKVSSEVASGGN